MNTGELLLKAVLADQADDLTRLVYADWLDENGQGERAGHIRFAVAHRGVSYSFIPWFKTGGVYWGIGDRGNARLTKGGVCKMLTSQFDHLLTTTTCPYVRGTEDNPNTVVSSILTLRFRRGFLEAIHCTLADWCGGGKCPRCEGDGVSLTSDYHRMRNCRHCDGTGTSLGIGPQVVAAHPVERVVLTDCEPTSHTHDWWWGFGIGGRNALPQDIYLLLPEDGQRRGFATRTTATQALSDAAIKWAKSQIS